MKVTIEITADTKVRLVNELKNIVENITRFDRFDKLRTHSQGSTTVQAEGTYSKFAVVDKKYKIISFHDTWDEAMAVVVEPQSVIDLNELL